MKDEITEMRDEMDEMIIELKVERNKEVNGIKNELKFGMKREIHEQVNKIIEESRIQMKKLTERIVQEIFKIEVKKRRRFT